MGYYIQVEPNVKLFVEDIGSGQPVVLIHGWPLSHEIFESQVGPLVSNGFRFIGIDLRGYGKSDKPYGGYDYDTIANDIQAVVDQLGLKNFILGGFSMGGPIVIRYLTKFGQENVDKLWLMGAAAPVFTKRKDFKIGMSPIEMDALIKLIKVDRPDFLVQFSRMLFHKKKTPAFLRRFQLMSLEAGLHSTIHSAIALRDEDLRDELAHITVPTAIFHGKKDEICPYELGEQLKKGIPNSVLVPFHHSGHTINCDEPKKFNTELIRFFKSSGVKQ